MENKYYTPDTQEEVVLYIMDNLTIWTSDINEVTGEPFELKFNKNGVTALNSLLQIINVVRFADGSVEYDFSPKSFRIKYLDSEDIEDLGFSDHGSFWVFPLKEEGRAFLWRWEEILFISLGYVGDDMIDASECFRGVIKNKSELKRLLTQLGIC